MKSNKKYIIIGVVCLLILAIVFGIIYNNSNNKGNSNNNNNKNELVDVVCDDDINIEYSFVQNNKKMLIIITNNSKYSIDKSSLKVIFKDAIDEKELNLLSVGNKSLMIIEVPKQLQESILEENIKIVYEIKSKHDNKNIVDVNKISNVKNDVVIDNNNYKVNIYGVNNTGKNLKVLNGFVLIYNDNKIVEGNTFRITNINNNSDFKTTILIPMCAKYGEKPKKLDVHKGDKPVGEIDNGIYNESGIVFENLKYDKVIVHFSYAY